MTTLYVSYWESDGDVTRGIPPGTLCRFVSSAQLQIGQNNETHTPPQNARFAQILAGSDCWVAIGANADVRADQSTGFAMNSGNTVVRSVRGIADLVSVCARPFGDEGAAKSAKQSLETFTHMTGVGENPL